MKQAITIFFGVAMIRQIMQALRVVNMTGKIDMFTLLYLGLATSMFLYLLYSKKAW